MMLGRKRLSKWPEGIEEVGGASWGQTGEPWVEEGECGAPLEGPRGSGCGLSGE